MFSRIAEWVRFHRGARFTVSNLRDSVREVEAETQAFIAKLSAEREAHLNTKADLRALRTDLADAKERAFWLEAENRDLRTKGGLKPKGDPAGSLPKPHPLPWEKQA